MKKIYVASKTKHADLWRYCRDERGYNIISTWIDEAGVGETSDWDDLASRCFEEVKSCDAFILFRQDGDELKGALQEVGIAMALGKDVYVVGDMTPYRLITENNTIRARSFWHAIDQITEKHQDPTYSWFVGDNPEIFTFGKYNTREDAAKAAGMLYGESYIIEAEEFPDLKLSDFYSSDVLMESANEATFDPEIPDVDAFEVSRDLVNDLDKEVRRTIDNWQEKHQIRFEVSRFKSWKDPEKIK